MESPEILTCRAFDPGNLTGEDGPMGLARNPASLFEPVPPRGWGRVKDEEKA